MQIYMSITILILFLLMAVFTASLDKRIGLPFSALLVIEGFMGLELIVALGFDLGLRWYHFHDRIELNIMIDQLRNLYAKST